VRVPLAIASKEVEEACLAQPATFHIRTAVDDGKPDQTAIAWHDSSQGTSRRVPVLITVAAGICLVSSVPGDLAPPQENKQPHSDGAVPR